jgi:hypothetical protein
MIGLSLRLSKMWITSHSLLILDCYLKKRVKKLGKFIRCKSVEHKLIKQTCEFKNLGTLIMSPSDGKQRADKWNTL